MPLPEKYPLENLTLESFPPENFPPEKLPPSPMNFFVNFFLSLIFFYGNFRRQVKSIFIQFKFLVINNKFFVVVVVVVVVAVVVVYSICFRLFLIFSCGI